VTGNEEIFPVIDKLRASKKFDYTFRTRDWHPANHASFQANNPGSELF
jgi:nicotinamidase-related amidase